MGQPQTVLFSGSRNWVDEDPIRGHICGLSKDSIVVHGGARGADMIADRLARKRGLHVARVDALWDFYGKRAGTLRNDIMLRLGIDFAFCYPLPDSRGTKHMMDRLRMAGIAYYIHGDCQGTGWHDESWFEDAIRAKPEPAALDDEKGVA